MDKLYRFSQIFIGPPKSNGTPYGHHVQIMSGFHLELNRQYATFELFSPPDGTLRKVFLIPGNHEFYEMSYDDGIAKRWDDESSKLTILGCTLWSSIPKHAEDDVTLRVSDYKMDKGWSVAQHNTYHAADLSFLTSAISDLDALPAESERLVLVITRHTPVITGTSRPKHEKKPWKEFARIAWWMFGHTHFTTEFQRGGIRVVANQGGYVLWFNGPTLENTRGVDAERVVEL